MKALMLAAGVGSRLFGDDRNQPPKALLEFEGKTLMQRHVETLLALGIDQLVLVVGYRKDDLVAEARRHAPVGWVRPIENPMYRGGPVISLWTARDVLREGEDVLFMDADVLYAPELLERLVRSEHRNCFLLDTAIDEGEDPVRLCLRGGVPVDFGKRVVGDFDVVGEWPGFMKMSPAVAGLVAQATENYIEDGQLDVTYEHAMRDVLVGEPRGTFGCEDITGIPWIEIDFPADLERARNEILARIETEPSNVVRPEAFNG